MDEIRDFGQSKNDILTAYSFSP